MPYQDEFSTHPLLSVQEHLSAAATHVAVAIKSARASRAGGVAALYDLRDTIEVQTARFKEQWETSI